MIEAQDTKKDLLAKKRNIYISGFFASNWIFEAYKGHYELWPWKDSKNTQPIYLFLYVMLFHTQKIGKSSITCKKAGF